MKQPVRHVVEVQPERHLEIVPLVVLAVAGHRDVGGHHQGLEAGIQRAGDEPFRQPQVLGHVELEPLRSPDLAGDALHRHERGGGQHVGHAGGLRRLPERDVGVEAIEPRSPGRRDAER
ncbi:hypothetical protein D3C83_03280 [compost metagenome]